jgi:hypothetical protein
MLIKLETSLLRITQAYCKLTPLLRHLGLLANLTLVCSCRVFLLLGYFTPASFPGGFPGCRRPCLMQPLGFTVTPAAETQPLA